MDELITNATPAQLRRLCRWLWGYFTGPLAKYVNEPEWIAAARKVLDA